jgi:hypothetical protein
MGHIFGAQKRNKGKRKRTNGVTYTMNREN